MQFLPPLRSMLAAWIGITTYLFALNAGAGLWYYVRLPAPPQAVASVPPPKPRLGDAPAARQPDDLPSQPGGTRNTSRPGIPGPAPGPSQPNPRPPVIIDPPRIETPPKPREPDPAPPPPAPRGLLLGPEPAPLKLRRRLLVLVLVSTDLVAAGSVEEADIPLRANLQGVLEHFRSDLAGERIYAVGQQGAVVSWDLAGPPGELVAPFEPEAYDAAIAAAGPALYAIVPPAVQSQYDVLLVWYSHIRPDDVSKTVAMPAELAENSFCYWGGNSSHEDSNVLIKLFPGRRWLLRRDDPPTSLVGHINSQLRRPQPAEGALP